MTVAQGTFALILLLTLANGIIHPNFLGPTNDWFADFIKLALSYPGGEHVRSGLLPALIDWFQATVDRSDVLLGRGGTAASPITHYHEPPLTTLFAVLAVKPMAVIDPVIEYLVLAAVVVAYTISNVVSVGRDAAEKALLGVTTLIAYPTLFMLDRGNLFAGLTCALILHAMVLTLRGARRPILSAILLALAINIRPNVVVFLLPLVALVSPWRWKLAPAVIAATAAVFVLALAGAHALYPQYTLASFRAGLAVYSRMYLVGNDGMAGGSSLMTPLKLLFGLAAATLGGLTVAAVIGLSAVWFSARRADRAVILFLVCAAYALGTSSFGDYHLAVFLIVPMAIVIDERPMTLSRFAAVSASVLVLAPKNEWFHNGLSDQVWINPLLLTAAAIVAIVATLYNDRPIWTASRAV